MASSRPIPIGGHGNGSQRSSPMEMAAHGDPSTGLLAHSLPANMHQVHMSRFQLSAGSRPVRPDARQPPTAPAFGSHPAPNFLGSEGSISPIPELILGPPAQTTDEVVGESPRRPASVVQFASSCPGDMGYLRQHGLARGSWAPSLQTPGDEVDELELLSKSPALALMSGLRDGRQPTVPGGRTVPGSLQPNGQLRPSMHYYASDELGSSTVSTELFERLRITSEEGVEEDDSEHEARYSAQLPTEQQRMRRAERRGSYGSQSDGGDPDIFEFEDQ